MDELNQRVMRVIDRMAVSKASFATDLEVSQAIISHITSGRNKPGVEILQKILQRYPKINAEWLLTGQGKMEKETDIQYTQLKQSLHEAQLRLQNNLLDLNGINDLLNAIKTKLES